MATWVYCHDMTATGVSLPEPGEPTLVVLKSLVDGTWGSIVVPAILVRDSYDPTHCFWISITNSAQLLRPFAWLRVSKLKLLDFDKIETFKEAQAK